LTFAVLKQQQRETEVSFVLYKTYTLLLGHHEEHLACKKLSDEVLVRLFVRSEVRIVCILSSQCHCIQKPQRLLPHLNAD